VKYIVSIFIVSILIFQSGVNTLFVINYHRSLEIYEAACVNKDKPEMNCHGKCKMMEETKKYGFLEEEDEQSPNVPVLKSMKNIDLFFTDSPFQTTFLYPKQLVKILSFKVCTYSNSISIPHPPPQFI